jgi:hypothetical protein
VVAIRYEAEDLGEQGLVLERAVVLAVSAVGVAVLVSGRSKG